MSALSERILGLPLDKTEQISDWSKRPLKSTQIHYAALDAYCLIEIYDQLYKTACANDTNKELFHYLEKTLRNNENKLPKSKANKKENAETEVAKSNEKKDDFKTSIDESKDLIEPPQFRVVCDNMLEVIL